MIVLDDSPTHSGSCAAAISRGQHAGGSSGGARGGGGGVERCVVCGAPLRGGVASELHMAAHERSGELARLAERQAREIERQQKDAEYEAALQADQRREEEAAERQRREREAADAARREREEAAKAKEAAERAEEERRNHRKRKREALAVEPEPGAPGVTRLRVRLPDGTVVERRFVLSATCAEVFLWLEGLDALAPLSGGWSLILRPPRVEGGIMPTDETLEELDLGGVTLFVQDDAA